jgi:hypothetical protein
MLLRTRSRPRAFRARSRFRCDAAPGATRSNQRAGDLQVVPLPSLLEVAIDTQSEPLGQPGNHAIGCGRGVEVVGECLERQTPSVPAGRRSSRSVGTALNGRLSGRPPRRGGSYWLPRLSCFGDSYTFHPGCCRFSDSRRCALLMAELIDVGAPPARSRVLRRPGQTPDRRSIGRNESDVGC